MEKELIVDYTSLSTASTCLRKYYWRFVRHLVPDQPESISVEFGKYVHDIRSQLAKGQLDFSNKIDAYRQKFADSPDTLRTPELLEQVMEQYWLRNEPISDVYTEVGFTVELFDGILYTGRIDYVTKIDGKLAVVDLKTTGSQIWLPQPKLNWQLVGYANALLTMTNERPEYVAIDGIVLSKRFDPENAFHFRVATVTDRDLLEWKNWVAHKVAVILHCYETGLFPMTAINGCRQFGDCPYNMLCKAPFEMEENLLRLFREEPWFPYEEDSQ